MSRQYYDPGKPDDQAPYGDSYRYAPQGESAAGEEGEEVYAGEYGDYGEEAPGELERSRGCSWMLITGLALALGLIGLVTWGVHEIATRGVARQLHQSFGEVSLLPASRVGAVKADLQIRVFYIVRGQALTAEMRLLPKPAGPIERMHLIAQQVALPPASRFLQSPLPKGTSIRALYLIDNILWLDMSPEFLKPENPSPLLERLVVYSLVNSFVLNDPDPSQPTVQGVRFMVGGQPIDTAWGWLDLSTPLGADLSLVR